MPPKRKEPTNKIINFYEKPEVKDLMTHVPNPNFDKTQITLPCRIGVVSASGGGKTNAILNFIKYTAEGRGSFCHIHIVHKTPEVLYDILAKKCKDNITFYTKLADLPEPKDLQPKDGHNLVIFDDQMAVKDQSKISNYYLYGRKVNGGIGCSTIYISQKYFKIPTDIRGQLNYLILLKIRGNKDISNIISDCNVGIDKEDFMTIYKDATKDEMDFMKIDIQAKKDNNMLSKNFNGYYEINDDEEDK